eukprot:TRINITY_DN637_c0_g1_i1.p1 TRINITY_DN637_c0_g1~~TRINITY_DN637_c0_g1_i1.p1  ORF type:complete len:155 (+),score=39.10 TRINITY_DN637_c0_g1_i1:66-530(+)
MKLYLFIVLLLSVSLCVFGDIQSNTRSNEIDELKTVFSVELLSDDEKLVGANLVGVVTKDKQQLLVAPVSTGPQGAYELSWVLDNKVAESGAYDVEIYIQEGENRENVFTTTLYHEKKIQERGIIPTQFLVLLMLIGSFGYMSWKKMIIESHTN